MEANKISTQNYSSQPTIYKVQCTNNKERHPSVTFTTVIIFSYLC